MASDSFKADPFLRGVEAGVKRAARYDVLARFTERAEFEWRNLRERLQRPAPPDSVGAQSLLDVRQLLRDTQASDRFSELFGEMATVAVISREAYGDPPLTEAEIASYQDRSSAFFNSFRHA